MSSLGSGQAGHSPTYPVRCTHAPIIYTTTPPLRACRLGLYAALKHHGPCTAAELAKHQGLNARYISEWLRQQASARVISTDEAAEKVCSAPVGP